MKNVASKRKAFTLIEVLVVVVIIGVLTAIAIPRFGKSKDKAYVTAQETDLRNAAAAEELVWDANGSYTGSVSRALTDTMTYMKPFFHSTPSDSVFIDSVAPSTGYRVRAHHLQLKTSLARCLRVGTLSNGTSANATGLPGNQSYGMSDPGACN